MQDSLVEREIGFRTRILLTVSFHRLLLKVIQMLVVEAGIHTMDGGAAVLADAPVLFFVEVPCFRLIREDDLGANYRSFSDAGVDPLDIGLLVPLCLQ